MAKKRRKSITCANCQYQFDGIDNYCPNCGQENHSHRAPFKHIIIELIESLTHFDTKFFSTVKALFLKPGLLTKDYIEDKRARYVPPVRLYVFVSFIFFLSLSFFSGEKQYRISLPKNIHRGDSIKQLNITFMGETLKLADTISFKIADREFVTDHVIDSIVMMQLPDAGWLEVLAYRQSVKQRLGLMTEDGVERVFIKNLGIALFFLMPIYALLLKLLYIRSKRYYFDHLIFSVHNHSFVFALFLIFIPLFELTGLEEAIALPTLFVLIYQFLALKKVYGGRWWKILIKWVLLTATYTVCVISVIFITAILSIIAI